MYTDSQTGHKTFSSEKCCCDLRFIDRVAETWGGNAALLECHKRLTGVTNKLNFSAPQGVQTRAQVYESPKTGRLQPEAASCIYPRVLPKYHVPSTP